MFKIGDEVYVAIHQDEKVQYPCPDCGGKGTAVLKTAHEEWVVPCAVCRGAWDEVRGWLERWERRPDVLCSVVGKVTVERTSDGDSVEYMVEKTGVGSGTIWHEDVVFSSYDEAYDRSKAKVKELVKEDKEREEKRRKERMKKPVHVYARDRIERIGDHLDSDKSDKMKLAAIRRLVEGSL